MLRLAVLFSLFACTLLSAVEYRFPADAKVLDVKRDFGAVGDGKTDDTDALQKAIHTALAGERFRNPGMIYLPKGTYLISRPLRARQDEGPQDNSQWCNGWRCGLFIAGESREKTIIQLADGSAEFTDPKKPQAVIVTGSTGHGGEHGQRKNGWGNEAFRNTLMNFTVDTGKNNPGASGVDFLASNRGTMEEVTVRSGDGSGVAGLDLNRPWPGPGLITHVSVEGFNYGLRQRGMDCSMTYEHLTFTGQKVAAILADDQPFMSLRGIISNNAVPAVLVDGGSAIINILDSELTWTGKGDAPAAITADCHLILKNVTSAGYSSVVTTPTGKNPGKVTLPNTGAKTTIAFHSSKSPTRLTDGDNAVPDLAVKETPIFQDNDFTKWANARNFSVGSRTAGIQEAIDSGAETVYLPNGSYSISETIILRGNLRKIMGLEASLSTPKGLNTTFLFTGVKGGMVHLEHLSGGDVVHDCDQTLVIRKCDINYRNSIRGTGDVFLEDGMFGQSRVLYPQHFWARQYNSEFGSKYPEFTNRGGTAWILGMKVEGKLGAVLNNGGITEIYALYAMTGEDSALPFVENRNGWMAVSLREGGQKAHKLRLQDTWDEKMANKGGSREVTLFVGGKKFDPTKSAAPAAPTAVQATAISATQVDLSWTAPTGDVAYYRIERNGKVVAGSDTTTWSDTDLTEKTACTYNVSAVSAQGGTSSTNSAKATTPADTVAPTLVKADVWPSDASVITIDVSEQLDSATATKTANYSVAPSATVKEAKLNAAGDRIILQLAAPIADGQETTVTCKNLKDRSQAGNAFTDPVLFTAWQRGVGFTAEFWNQGAEVNFKDKPDLVRMDRKIDFWWGGDSPDPAITAHPFSARFSGILRPKVTGEYRFRMSIRTGARLTLDGKVLHDSWNPVKNEWIDTAPIQLEAGKLYNLVLESHHNPSGSGIRLQWYLPGKDKASYITEEYVLGE